MKKNAVRHQLYWAGVRPRSSAKPSIFALPMFPRSRKERRYSCFVLCVRQYPGEGRTDAVDVEEVAHQGQHRYKPEIDLAQDFVDVQVGEGLKCDIGPGNKIIDNVHFVGRAKVVILLDGFDVRKVWLLSRIVVAGTVYVCTVFDVHVVEMEQEFSIMCQSCTGPSLQSKDGES